MMDALYHVWRSLPGRGANEIRAESCPIFRRRSRPIFALGPISSVPPVQAIAAPHRTSIPPNLPPPSPCPFVCSSWSSTRTPNRVHLSHLCSSSTPLLPHVRPPSTERRTHDRKIASRKAACFGRSGCFTFVHPEHNTTRSPFFARPAAWFIRTVFGSCCVTGLCFSQLSPSRLAPLSSETPQQAFHHQQHETSRGNT